MTKRLHGEISIGRLSGAPDDETIRIEVVDQTSRTHFLDLRMSLEAFAEAVMGRGYCPCTFELRGAKYVGMKREVKAELVPFDSPWSVHAGTRAAIERMALAAFEVDGWEGRCGDLWNSHNDAGKNDDGVPLRRVVFTRLVDDDGASDE